MLNLSRRNQIAMAVISASTGHANSQQMATETLDNAEKQEWYEMATDSHHTPEVRMTVSKEGVYTFRTFN